MNRRRILAGIISVGVLGLLCPLHTHMAQDSRGDSCRPRQRWQPPSEPVNSTGNLKLPVIPVPVVEAKAASRPPVPQSLVGIPDVDPHKAFGSKSAPVTMEVFSDFQCPACKTLFTTTNRRLMDDYVSSWQGVSNSP